jgi:RNA polymerase sigma-70 factor, ECF subfamily
MAEVDLFQAHRARLFGVAYRMLGSASDADDVVQDAWLRYSGAQLQLSAA